MPVETAAPSAPPATPPTDENATSEVSGWLQAHGHPELAETFAKAGYKSLADLTPDAIRKTLSAQPPGVVAELVRLRKDDLEEAKPLAALGMVEVRAGKNTLVIETDVRGHKV